MPKSKLVMSKEIEREFTNQYLECSKKKQIDAIATLLEIRRQLLSYEDSDFNRLLSVACKDFIHVLCNTKETEEERKCRFCGNKHDDYNKNCVEEKK